MEEYGLLTFKSAKQIQLNAIYTNKLSYESFKLSLKEIFGSELQISVFDLPKVKEVITSNV